MTGIRAENGLLPERERQALSALLLELSLTWHVGRLAELVGELPAEGAFRRLALTELIKIDLERSWQHGWEVSLVNYLARFPELGTADTAPAELIVAEYEARKQLGTDLGSLAEVLRRYPQRAEEVRRLMQRAGPPAVVRARKAGGEGTYNLTGLTQAPACRGRELPPDFGRYRVLRQLGEGGMGTVYLARDKSLGRLVALKVPHFAAADGAGVRERFYREARAAAGLHHPNVCPIYEVGEADGTPYLTMAYVEGRSLAEEVRERGPLPGREAAALAHALALALMHAHGQGVIHRDVKPSNVMLSGQGVPVLMDFGLARLAGQAGAGLTRPGALLGSPAYMPPEQVLHKEEAGGPGCDVYGLGAVLYELLTGRPPYAGGLETVLYQVLHEPPEPPARVRPGLPRALEVICLKALAKRPEDRYATMEDMAAALAAYLKSGARPAPARKRRLRAALTWVAALLVGAAALWLLGGALTPGESQGQWGEAKVTVRPPRPASPRPEAPVPAPPVEPRKGGPVAGKNERQAQPTLLKEARRFEHPHELNSAVLTADGKFALSATSGDRSVRRWSLESGRGVGDPLVFEEHTGGLVLSPRGHQVLGDVFDMLVWDARTGQHLRTVRTFSGPVGPRAFSPTGRYIVTSRVSNLEDPANRAVLSVVDLESGRVAEAWAPEEEGQLPSAVAVSADGKLAASASGLGLRLWEMGAPAKEVLRVERSSVTALAIAPDGKSVLGGHQVGVLLRWDARTGKELGRFEGHTGVVNAVTFSPDGRLALSGGLRTARLWDVATGRELARLVGHEAEVRSVAFSADGRRAVTGSADRTVRVWGLPAADGR